MYRKFLSKTILKKVSSNESQVIKCSITNFVRVMTAGILEQISVLWYVMP